MNKLQIISSGIVKNNPTFVLVLGMCPTLGTTTSAENGMGMGLATMAVLIMSNLVISLIKNIIPDKVRIPAFIVVIASFVTIIQMLMQAYVPALYGALGVFIPLIVVNCIILGRAEAFASKNSPLDSILDGVGIGLGFTLALTVELIAQSLQVSVELLTLFFRQFGAHTRQFLAVIGRELCQLQFINQRFEFAGISLQIEVLCLRQRRIACLCADSTLHVV